MSSVDDFWLDRIKQARIAFLPACSTDHENASIRSSHLLGAIILGGPAVHYVFRPHRDLLARR